MRTHLTLKGDPARQLYQTPPDLFRVLHRIFDFTVDAAASKANALLQRYWTEKQDAMRQDWSHETVFCNPPFKDIPRFLEKARTARRAIVLVPLNFLTSPSFGQGADCIIIPKGRVKYLLNNEHKTSPTFGTCFLLYGKLGHKEVAAIASQGWRSFRNQNSGKVKAKSRAGRSPLQLLRDLAAELPPQHRWQPYADLLNEALGIEEANARGFTVVLPDGTRTVEPSGGLTEDLYWYLAPMLDEFEKTDLASGVLAGLTRFECLDLDLALALLGREHDAAYEHEWLPDLVQKQGFDSTSGRLVALFVEHRKENPSPRLRKRAGSATPCFDEHSGSLSYREHRWTFNKRIGGPAWEHLCDFGRRGWPRSTRLERFDPEQVTGAARWLRQKTKALLNWTAHCDGYLSWNAVTTSK